MTSLRRALLHLTSAARGGHLAVAPLLVAALAAASGCDGSITNFGFGYVPPDLAPPPPAPPADMARPLPTIDFALPPLPDGADPPPPNGCGDFDPRCLGKGRDPGTGDPFVLGNDPVPDPNAADDGVSRDPNGYLVLDSTHAVFDFLWIANSGDWNRGTISKIDSKSVREVARYPSVTCFSLPTGSRAACDGTKGCCAMDDDGRYKARVAMKPLPPRQSVQLTANAPSRTAVDFNGDVWVANRAFGGQGSVSKIANDLANCIDRNGNGRIDTSSDVNGDGQIQTDCNADNQPDDLAGVLAKPCANGKAQEFYGPDDECLLFTTNVDVPNQFCRPLALGQGELDFGPSDAWPGNYQDGRFFRVDGGSGQIKADTQVTGNPYGATIDADGVLWVALINDGRLSFFDTHMPKSTGITRRPVGFGLNAYGITLDRDQNVWQGGWTSANAFRYTPDRTKGFAGLAGGVWTVVTNPGASNGASGNSRGIASDSRTMTNFYIWVARDGGWISRIDPTQIPPTGGADLIFDGTKGLAYRVAGGGTIGAGVDKDQNVWGISQSGSVATRIPVGMNGVGKAPDIASAAVGMNKCPAGDRCVLRDTAASDPAPYTYSDFTGFGLRNFTRPHGSYSVVSQGCKDVDGNPAPTQWYSLVFDALVPPNTQLTARLRTGPTPKPDATWGGWTPEFDVSPVDLRTGMPLQPFDKNNYFIQVEFRLTTLDKNASPKLKKYSLNFKCGGLG